MMSNVIPFPIRKRPRLWQPGDITIEQSVLVYQWLCMKRQRKQLAKRRRAA